MTFLENESAAVIFHCSIMYTSLSPNPHTSLFRQSWPTWNEGKREREERERETKHSKTTNKYYSYKSTQGSHA